MKSIEELEAAQKQGDLVSSMMQKITQTQLNRLIVKCAGQDEIKFRDLLEKNNYFPDLSGLTVDGNKFKALKKLDFSGLSLTSSKLHNLAAADISFAGSNLSNANINLKRVSSIDFTRADLTRSYIYGMKMSQASFDETIMHNSIIINSQNDKSPLSEQQKAQTIDLVIAPESSFKQGHLTKKFDILNQDGVCNGLCVELARYVLMSQEKDGGYGDYLEKVKRKIENPSMNFICRVQSYQDHLQASESDITIDTEKVRNHQFLESIPDEIKHSDILGCGVSVSDKARHIFSVIKLRDETKNIVGYKVFDPNYGDITCKNEAELNQQVNLLFQHYQRDATNIESTIKITALDDLVKKHGLIHPKDVNFSEEEKAANKEKKYAKMSEQERLCLIIIANADIAKAKTKIESMSIDEINQPITLKDGSTTSLLMLAVKANKLEIVEALIKKKAEVNTPNVDARSPLCIADIRQYTEIKEALIKAGADGSIKYGQSISAKRQKKLDKELITSARRGETEQMKMLLEKGANPKAKDEYGRIVLHIAAENGAIDALELLIKSGADINAKSEYEKDYTALHFAAGRGHLKILAKLIELGADIEAEDSKDTALHRAVATGAIDALELLIKLGADINAKNHNGNTALHMAAARGEIDTLEILRDLGADINAKNHDGNTALHMAAKNGTEVLELGADIYAKDIFYRTKNAAIGTFAKLIELGADIDAKNRNGDTALHIAAIDSKDKLFEKIIDLIKDNDNRAAKFIVHLINDRSGYIRDNSENWKAVESIVKNINEDSRVDVICEVLNEIKNLSRRSRLLKLLPEDEQKLVEQEIIAARPTVPEVFFKFNEMLRPSLSYTPPKRKEEKGGNER